MKAALQLSNPFSFFFFRSVTILMIVEIHKRARHHNESARQSRRYRTDAFELFVVKVILRPLDANPVCYWC